MRAWISLLTAALIFALAGCSKTDDAAEAPAADNSPSTVPAPAPDQTAPPPSEDTTSPDTTTPPQQETPPPPQ